MKLLNVFFNSALFENQRSNLMPDESRRDQCVVKLLNVWQRHDFQGLFVMAAQEDHISR
jgi:hypothetical protein